MDFVLEFIYFVIEYFWVLKIDCFKNGYYCVSEEDVMKMGNDEIGVVDEYVDGSCCYKDVV